MHIAAAIATVLMELPWATLLREELTSTATKKRLPVGSTVLGKNSHRLTSEFGPFIFSVDACYIVYVIV